MIGESIVRDLEQPGAEPGVRLVTGAGHDHPLPDVLVQLLCGGVVTQLVHHETEQGSAMAGVQHFERRPVAGAVGQHQFFVGRLRLHGRSVTDAERRAKQPRAWSVNGLARMSDSPQWVRRWNARRPALGSTPLPACIRNFGRMVQRWREMDATTP